MQSPEKIFNSLKKLRGWKRPWVSTSDSLTVPLTINNNDNQWPEDGDPPVEEEGEGDTTGAQPHDHYQVPDTGQKVPNYLKKFNPQGLFL